MALAVKRRCEKADLRNLTFRGNSAEDRCEAHTAASTDKAADWPPSDMMVKYDWSNLTMYLRYGEADDARRAHERQLTNGTADRLGKL
jgi:hypothetical protein